MQEDSIRIISDATAIDREAWSRFVHAHKEGNFFQLPEAYALFSKVPGYTPHVHCAVSVIDDSIQGILVSVVQQEPAFYGALTSRSIVWGGPLCNSAHVASALLQDYLQTIGKKAIYSQFRNIFSCEGIHSAFTGNGFTYLPHLNFLVHTQSCTTDSLLSKMSKSKARQVRKGLSTAQIVECKSEEEAAEFYSMLRQLYRKKVNKPLPPPEFFEAFQRDLVPKGLGCLLLVRHEGKTIGGILCPVMPGKAIYEWYITGEDHGYKDQYPSILSTWAAIQYAQNHELEHFDFLGAGKPDADYGVRSFKEKFGGELVQYGRYEMVHNPFLMKVGTFGLKLYKFIRSGR